MSQSQAFPSIQDIKPDISILLGNLACPVCNDPQANILPSKFSAHCDQCNANFPLYKCGEHLIPWLFENPTLHLLEWKARLNGFLHINQLEQYRLKEAKKDKRISKTGQKRIAKLLEAKKLQVTQVLELLSPLDLDLQEDELLSNPARTLQSKVPKTQGLDSYYNNIFRDWSWENGENEEMLKVIDSVIPRDQLLEKVLTIGAGAGRLSYDIQEKYSPTYSALLDINPLLLLAGCQAIQGNKFKLQEFPIAPLNKNSYLAEQICCAPKANSKNIYYIFGDGLNPPVKEESFDTIITPWLIDIIPLNLRDYIPRINACLPIGGNWINTGSLAFFHKQQAWCYSEEEVIELVEKNGFEIISSNRTTIQYLRSPLSAHGRTETVFTFNAKKIKAALPSLKHEYLPDWLRSTSTPIPKQYEQEISSSKYLLHAQVLGAIDGTRNIEQIGQLIAKQYNLPVDEATHAVRQILIDYYEEN